jgi:hypothetical protein
VGWVQRQQKPILQGRNNQKKMYRQNAIIMIISFMSMVSKYAANDRETGMEIGVSATNVFPEYF